MGVALEQQPPQHQIEMPGQNAQSQFSPAYHAAQNVLHEPAVYYSS